MPNEIKANDRIREQAREQARDLNEFDYNAPAELFPGRNMKGGRQVKYKRFDSAAEALRQATVEEGASTLTAH
jgi:hypothetical protein